MKVSWRFLVVTVFLAGFLVTGLLGTSTSMSFIWPGYVLLGLAGAISVGVIFKEVSFVLPKWTTAAVFALGAYLLIRACDSPVEYFAREDAALVIAAFLCYGLFLSLFTVQRWRQGLVYALAALVIANLAFAVLQNFVNPSLWLIPGYERTFPDRVGGLFNHPDHFAGFLAVTVPLWLALATFGRSERIVKMAWGGLAGLSMIAVLLTGGMVGLSALVVGVLAFAGLSCMIVWPNLGVRRRSALLCGIAGVAVVAALGLTIKTVAAGRLVENNVAKGASESLLPIWEAGLKQVAEAPLAGTGSRTSYIYGRAFRSGNLDVSVTEAEFVHNEYLQTLADYGIVGLLLLLAMLAVHFTHGFRFVKAYVGFGSSETKAVPRSDHLALALGALATLGALGYLSAFDFVMHMPVFAILAAVLLAVLAAPDPMAAALRQQEKAIMPGGSLMFANRSVVFGCGLAMTVFGVQFTRSEFNYELARLAFEADSRNFKQFRQLQAARELDPKNPFAFSLSAHAQVAGITPDTAPRDRRQVLGTAGRYFSHARELYPQDVFAAIGHAAVLDELGWKDRARRRLEEAREHAPLYGNLMLAEAEHRLRHGEVSEAESAFLDASAAAAFRDEEAALEGLRTISEWKLIAQQNGIHFDEPAGKIERSLVREAKVEERVVAGDAGGQGKPAEAE
ncbi:MAG: O-antigen ligase family protein [Verrucomicrobiales bacterium]